MAVIITEFQLDQFHGGTPLRVLDLGSGLNVALVRDEVGRQQLLRVAPWFLYGPGDFFPQLGEQANVAGTVPGVGGSMQLRTDHGVFQLDRTWSDSDSHLQLIASDGQAFGEEYLANILERLPARTYREVLTFDLARMGRIVQGRNRGKTRLSRLATYLKHKSPQPTQTAVVDNRRDLESLNLQVGELAHLLAVNANLDANDEQEDLSRSDRDKLKRELKKLDEEIADAQAKLRNLQSEIDQTQCAIAVTSIQERLDESARELDDLRSSKKPEISTGSREAAERLEHKIAACRDEIKEYKSELEDLTRQGKELGDLNRFSKLVPQIDAILIQEKSLVKEESAIEQLSIKLQDLESKLDVERMSMSTISPASLASGNAVIDSHVASRVDSLSQRLRETERETKLAEERLARAETSSSLLEQGMAQPTSLATHPEDAVSIHDAEQRVLRLRELLELDEQRHRLDAEQEDLQIQLRRLYANQLMPFRMTMALGVPFMIGVAMIIYGLLMSQPANWQLILLGFIAALATTMIKMSVDNQTDELMKVTRRRLSKVTYQLDELAAAHESLGTSGVSIARQLGDAETQLELLTERFAAREPVAVSPNPILGSASLETARIQLNESRRRQAELNQQWRELMIELGLSPNLTPQHAKEALADRAMHAPAKDNSAERQALEFQIQHVRHDLERRGDWLSGMIGQATQLIKELNVPSAGATAGEQMDILRESLSDYKERNQTRRQLQRSIKRVKDKIRRTNEKGRQLTDQRKKIEEELELKKKQHQSEMQLRKDRIKQFERQRDRLEQEIQEVRSRYRVSGELPLDLSEEDLLARLDELTENLERLMERMLRKSEKRGRCRAQLNSGNHRSQIAWDDLLRKADQIAQECKTHDVTQTVVVGEYEYLKLASRFLSQLSSNQLVRLDVPQDNELVVVDNRGNALDLSDVRTEHYANIYFSLWLARLEAYAEAGLRLPIVVEDPVQSTDDDSKLVVATLLRDFAAKGHQVFLVTSSPENAELYAQLDVPIADLSERMTEIVKVAEEYPNDVPSVSHAPRNDSDWQLPTPTETNLEQRPAEPQPVGKTEQSPRPTDKGPLFPRMD